MGNLTSQGHQVYILLWILLSLSILIGSCERKIKIKGFDEELWKTDRDGCSGNRKEQLSTLLVSKEKLLGISEQSIMDFLGTPDRNDLYARRQKFYIYYIDPGPACTASVSLQTMLIIRFNATGYSNEVYSQDGFSTK
jgi:hypothetical protein